MGEKPIAPKDVLGLILDQEAKRNQPLLMRRLRRPVVVHRGDEVQIVVASGSVRVSSQATALAAGRIGDVISVSRASGKSRAKGYRMRARVVGSGMVVMQLGDSSGVRR